VAAEPSLALSVPEPCTALPGPPTLTSYQASIHRFFDKMTAFVVQCSGDGVTWNVVTDYQMFWSSGIIQFNTARVVGLNDQVRINSGNYFNTSRLGDCDTWELTISSGTVDTTSFQNQWKVFTPVDKTATGKLTGFMVDNFFELQLASIMAFDLYTDYTANQGRWSCFGVITGVAPKSSSTSVVTQDIDFTASDEVHYYASF